MELKPEAFKGIMFKAKRSEKIFKKIGSIRKRYMKKKKKKKKNKKKK